MVRRQLGSPTRCRMLRSIDPRHIGLVECLDRRLDVTDEISFEISPIDQQSVTRANDTHRNQLSPVDGPVMAPNYQ